MSPETRAFLDGVRDADDPTPEDERRVLRAVRAAVAAGALVAGTVGAAKTTKITTLFGVSGLKLGGVLVGLGAFAWLGGWMLPLPNAALVPSAPASRRASEPASIASGWPPSSSAFEVPEKPQARPPESIEPRPRDVSKASLREEIALLADVRAALARGDGATALGRLDGHRTTDRQFLAERRAARILALCSLGRADDARHAAAEFLLDHPSSVQRAAVERSCAGTKGNGER